MFNVPFLVDFELNVVPVALYYFGFRPLVIAAVAALIMYLITDRRKPTPKPVRIVCICIEAVFALAWILMAVLAFSAGSLPNGDVSVLRRIYAMYLTNKLWRLYIIPGVFAGIHLGEVKNHSKS